MLIFPRKNFSEQLVKGAPPGTIFRCLPSGWINMEVFCESFDYFIATTKPSRDSPVHLILDGHYSHTRNLKLIDRTRRSHVSIVCLPPHSTLKLQPLDKTFMGALKHYYSEEVRTFMLAAGRPVTHFDVPELFGRAYLKTQTRKNTVNGFRATVIYLVNINLFLDVDFAAAEEEECLQEVTNDNNVPDSNQQAAVSPSTCCQSLVIIVTPSQIHPLSTTFKPAASNRGRPKGTVSVITSSPFRMNLAESRNRGVSTKPRALFPMKNKKANLTSQVSTAVQA
jgi:hypothetical protein